MELNNLRQNKVISSFVAAAFLLLQSNLGYAQAVIDNALPQGATTVAGSATYQYDGNVLNQTTATDKTITDWQSMNVGAANTWNIFQPTASSISLNRTGQADPAQIYGNLNSNGRVFLVNPNGVFFGAGSHVDVNGLVGSTLNISNADFMAGKYNFIQNGQAGYVINQGQIVANGGFVLLLSNAVNNSGSIVATLGKVILAAGEKMTVALDDTSDISVTIDEAVKNNVFGPDGQKIADAIKNSGTISADGGKVLLNAKVMNDVFDYAVNNSGVIQAKGLVNHNGSVELIADGGDIIAKSGSVVTTQAADNIGQGGTIHAYSNTNTIIEEGAVFDISGGIEGGDAGFADLSALGNIYFAGMLNGYAAEGFKLGEFIIDPTDATIAGSVSGTVTVWATNNISITGNVTIASGGTLNLFADATGSSGTFEDGIGTITRAGNFTIGGGNSGTRVLNMQAGSGIGTSGSAIQTSGLSSVNATLNPTSGSGGIYISNSGNRDLTVSANSHNSTISLTSTSSDLILGTINAGTSSAFLTSAGTITQTGALTADILNVTATSGNTTLNNSGNAINKLGTIDAAGRTFSLTDNVVGGLTQTGVITASTFSLTNTAGNTDLSSQNNLISNLGTINAAGHTFSIKNTTALAQTGVLTANTLNVTNTSGATDLSSQSNVISHLGTINAAGQTFSVKNTQALDQTGVLSAATLNVTNTAGNTDLSSQNNVIGNLGTINATGRTFSIKNTQALGQTGALTADTLNLTNTAGATTLTNTSNAISHLGNINATGQNVSISNTNAIDQAVSTSITADTLAIKTLNNGGAAITLTNGNDVNNIDLRSRNAGDSANRGGAVSYTGNAGFNLNNITTTGTANLTAGGAISQSGAVTAATLNVTNTSGDTILNNSSNSIDALGTINASGRTFTLVDNVSGGLTQTGALTADTLNLTNTSGSTTLNNAGNSINKLGSINATNQTFTLVDNIVSGLTQVGALVASTLNLTNTSGNTTLDNSANAINTLGLINAGTKTFTLTDNVAGGLNQSNVLTAGTLNLTNTASNTNLGTENNVISNLGTINAAGRTISLKNTVALNQTDVLTADTLNLTNTAGNTNLSTQNNAIAHLGTIDATGRTFSLNNTQSFDQSGALTADALLIKGSGSATLTNASNNVNTVAANVDGNFSYTDSNGVTVGSVNGTDGLSASNVTVNTGNTLTINKNIASAGTVTLNASTGGVTATAGSIFANDLLLLGKGAFDLSNASNDVTTLAADINGTLTYTDANALTVGNVSVTDGLTSNKNDITLNTGNTITIAKNINAGTGTVTLNTTAGGVTEAGGSITAKDLLLNGAGTYNLSENNNVDNIAANVIGSVIYKDVDALNVETVGTTNGITTNNNDVTILTGGLLNINQNINAGLATVTLNSANGVDPIVGAVIANNLLLLGSGLFELLGANDVGTLAANINGELIYNDINALTIGSVNGTNGVTTNGNNVTLTLGNTLNLTKDLNAGTGTVNINTAAGGVNQTAGKLVAANLALTGAGNSSLTSSTNDVGTIAADINGSLTYTDSNALSVGKVSGTTGITTQNNNVSLSTGNTLTLAQDVNAGNATVALNTTAGGVNQAGGAVLANNLLLTGTGAFNLTDSKNDVSALAANTSGSVSYNDTNALTVGSVLGTNGIATANNNVVLTTGDAITLNQSINAGTGTVTLNPTNGGVLQNAGSVLAQNLLLLGKGAFNLSSLTNAVSNLAADITGALTFVTSGSLTVGTVNGTNGIDSKSNDVSLTAGGSMVIANNLYAGKGNVTLNAPGGVNQTGGDITGGNLLLLGNGDFTLNSANNDVDVLAAAIDGILSYTDSNDLTVATINGTNGINTTGHDVTLHTGSALTLVNDITADASIVTLNTDSKGVEETTGKITADSLLLLGKGDSVLNGTNDVNTIASSMDGSFEYTDINDLIIGTVNGVNGIVADGDVTLDVAGLLTISKDIAAGKGVVTLDTNGVTQTVGGGSIFAKGLRLFGAGDFILNNNNDVDSIAADIDGALEYTDIDDVEVDNTKTTDGITTNNHNVTINAGNTIALNAMINAGTGDVILNTTAGGVNQKKSGITASNLLLTGNGDFSLTKDNDVNMLAADVYGDLEFTDINVLEICSILGVDGINTHGYDVTIETGDTLTIEENINAGAGNVKLDSANGVEQTDGDILANGLRVLGAGIVNLTSATNDVNTFAADVDGAVSYTDVNTLTIGKVGNTQGIKTNDDNVIIKTGDTLTMDDDIKVGNANVTLDVINGLNQTGGFVKADGLLLLGTGNFDLGKKNTVNILAADITGNLTYTDNASVTIGTVEGVSGVTTNGGDIAFDVNEMFLEQDVNAGTGDITIETKKTVIENGGAIIGNRLTLTGKGDFILDGNNDVNFLAALISKGDTTFTDIDDLTIDNINGINGIQSLDGKVVLNTGGLLTIAADIYAGVPGPFIGDVTINSNGGVNQTTGIINAINLLLTGAGNFSLDNAANNVSNLAGNVDGNVSYTDASGINVGTIGAVSGLTTTGDITLTADVINFNSLTAGDTVTLQQLTDGLEIDLGTKVVGKLSFDQADLDNITANTIAIGNAKSGTAINSDNITVTTANGLVLTTGADIQQTSNKLLTVNSLGLNAGAGVGDAGAINTDVASLSVDAGGDVNISNQSGVEVTSLVSGGTATLLTGGDTQLDSVNTEDDFIIRVASGNLRLSGTLESNTGAVNLRVDNGSLFADAGNHVIAKTDSLFSTPNGTMGLDNAIDVDITGNLILDIGAKSSNNSGFFTGIVRSPAAGDLPVFIPSNYPSPLRPPGNVFFNGERIWPSARSFSTSQFVGQTLGQFVFPSITQLPITQINTFDVASSSTLANGPVFLYHPLTEVDNGAFDEEFQLDEGAYDFIEGELKKKKKKQEVAPATT